MWLDLPSGWDTALSETINALLTPAPKDWVEEWIIGSRPDELFGEYLERLATA